MMAIFAGNSVSPVSFSQEEGPKLVPCSRMKTQKPVCGLCYRTKAGGSEVDKPAQSS